MSLSSATSRTPATGSDSANVYNYGFRIFASTDLLVTVRNTTTQVESVLVLTTDYTVQGIGLQSGTITLVSAGQLWIDGSGFLAAGYVMVVRRVRPLTQTTSLRNQGTFYASVHEDTFDMLVMVDQQHDDMLQRAVILPETVTSATFNPVLPTSIAAPPAGAVLVINPAGNGWALGSPVVGFKTTTLQYTAFAVSALTDQITAFVLPKGSILMGVALKHSSPFTGGSVSAVTLDLGITGNDSLFLSSFDVFQSVSDTAFKNALISSIQSFANDTNVKIKATSVGGNLNTLTQGVVTIYYWYLNLNQGA